MTILYLWLIIPIIFAVLHFRRGSYFLSTAVTLSCAVIAIVLREPIVIAAYLCSIAGDYFMVNIRKAENNFIFGILCFFAAHVFFLWYGLHEAVSANVLQYAASASVIAVKLIIIAAVFVGYSIFLICRIYPALRGNIPMKIATAMYTYISCAVFSVSILGIVPGSFPSSVLFSIGIAFIVFSDTIIALCQFTNNKKYGKIICPTYFACHIFIAASIIAGL